MGSRRLLRVMPLARHTPALRPSLRAHREPERDCVPRQRHQSQQRGRSRKRVDETRPTDVHRPLRVILQTHLRSADPPHTPTHAPRIPVKIAWNPFRLSPWMTFPAHDEGCGQR